jgi:hypothetical protein
VDDRDRLIQCGEALFHLRLALQRLGRIRQVQLFPDLEDLSLVARIPCEFSCDLNALESLTAEELLRNRNEFMPVNEAAVSGQILARLATVGTNGRAWLDFSQSGLSRKHLYDLEMSSHSYSSTASRYDEELMPQALAAAPRLKEAIKDALGFFGASRIGSLLLGPSNRGPTVGSIDGAQPEVKTIREMESLAVLKTKTDDRYGWLAAGEVMARARSEAHGLGITSQVFGQAFRKKGPRQELRNIIGHKGYVQAIIGFGSQSVTSNIGFDLSTSTQPPASATASQIQMRMS